MGDDANKSKEHKKLSLEFDDVEPGISSDEVETGFRRKLQIVTGVLVVIGGIVLLPLPGPGWAIIVVGLNMIKPDSRLVRWIRRKVPGIPEEGAVPKKVIFIGLVVAAIATVIGILYGDAISSWAWDLIFRSNPET